MKDFGKMIQDQKPNNGNDVKCAEIKTLPTGTNGYIDRPKVFKIGEYNRATASFEMNNNNNNCKDELKKPDTKGKFDVTSDSGHCNYFKSSFARSMVVNNNKNNSSNNNNAGKCKSMDFPLQKRNGYENKKNDVRRRRMYGTTEEDEDGEEDDRNLKQSNGYSDGLWSMPGKEVS